MIQEICCNFILTALDLICEEILLRVVVLALSVPLRSENNLMNETAETSDLFVSIFHILVTNKTKAFHR